MVPLADLEECRTYKEKGFLIAGERKGEQIPGFDFGNSPFSFMLPHVKDANIAITTTNGTKAIEMAVAREAKDIIIGAFPNIQILCNWLRAQNEHIVLLCSGWQDHPNIEDTIFAGAVARELANDFYYYQDSALMADMLYFIANVRKKYFIRNSSHYNRLIHLNLQKEVKYALRWNTHPVLPLLIGDELRDISKMEGDLDTIKKQLLQERIVFKQPKIGLS
jgi:2-phosphosulfolactate phosphatase